MNTNYSNGSRVVPRTLGYGDAVNKSGNKTHSVAGNCRFATPQEAVQNASNGGTGVGSPSVPSSGIQAAREKFRFTEHRDMCPSS